MLEVGEYWGTLTDVAESIINKKSTYEDLWEHMFVKGTPYQYLVLHHSHNTGQISYEVETIKVNPGGWYDVLKKQCFYAVREDIKNILQRRGFDPDSF